MINTISSREFNQNVGNAKRATNAGPVFITDRGHVAHVLLSISDYEALTKDKDSIVDLIAMDNGDFEFDPPKLEGPLIKPAVFD